MRALKYNEKFNLAFFEKTNVAFFECKVMAL